MSQGPAVRLYITTKHEGLNYWTFRSVNYSSTSARALNTCNLITALLGFTFYLMSWLIMHCSYSSALNADVLVPLRSWNAFHVCANSALDGCPGEAAAVWESLRQESRKTQFSGNLYSMCASRTTLPPSTMPVPQSPPTSDQTNQETLKGQSYKHSPTLSTLLFPVCSTLLLVLKS